MKKEITEEKAMSEYGRAVFRKPGELLKEWLGSEERCESIIRALEEGDVPYREDMVDITYAISDIGKSVEIVQLRLEMLEKYLAKKDCVIDYSYVCKERGKCLLVVLLLLQRAGHPKVDVCIGFYREDASTRVFPSYVDLDDIMNMWD
jgi:hypothetical protein